MPLTREVTQVVAAASRRDGNGLIVRHAFPGPGLEGVDPFLRLDHLGPFTFEPGKAGGEHERLLKGFETATYVLAGEFEHEDSEGRRAVLGPGDLQWMTAGSGLMCSEMPSRRIREQGGRVHAVQVWVSVPPHLRAVPPRYQNASNAQLLEGRSAQGRARVRVVAGSALGIRGPIETNTPICFQLWSLDPGADITFPLPADQQGFVYVLEGAAGVGDEPSQLNEGDLAVLGPGTAVRLHGYVAPDQASRLLLAAGVPVAPLEGLDQKTVISTPSPP
jgi:redox-sensitive bicupin YhaK (pirin superfamily)